MAISDPDTYDEKKEADFLEYLWIIWRRKWLVLFVVVSCTSLVLLYSLVFSTPQYESSTRLLQRQLGLDTAFLGSGVFQNTQNETERFIQTSAELVKSPEVVSAVMNSLGDRLGDMTEKELVGRVAVKTEQKIDIIEVTATDPDPVLAADIANAFAEEYINWRQSIDKNVLAQAMLPLEQQLTNTPDRERNTTEYAALQEKLRTLELIEKMQLGSIQIVNKAKPSLLPVSPKPLRNGAVIFITSLFAGVFLAILVDKRLDTKIRNTGYIASISSKPILAFVPKEALTSESLIARSKPQSSSGEAFRLLRTNLQFMNPGTEIKSILVTSPGSLEGKSTTIANLAITLAKGDQTVTVMELDIRRPSLTMKLGLSKGPGLTSVIMGLHELKDVVRIISADNPDTEYIPGKDQMTTTGFKSGHQFFCYTSGMVPPNPGELIASEKTRSIIEEVTQKNDYVLIDSPPLGVISDAANLSQYVDGVIIVVKLQQSDKRTLNRLLDTLSHLHANLLGFVIMNAEVDNSRYYDTN